MGGCGGTEVRAGSPAPALAGTTLDGTGLDLASLRGHPVVVNFWASWCTPCRDELPLLRERLAALGASEGLVIVGVLYKDDPVAAAAFADEMGVTWPTVTDPDGAHATAWRVVAPPQTYFVDAEGVIRAIQIGEVRAEDFAAHWATIAP